MQRSLAYQSALTLIFWVGVFVLYESLTSIYLLLPPLAAVLFFAFHTALKKHDLMTLLGVIAMLLVYETEKGFWFGSMSLFYSLISVYVVPKLEQMMRCEICLKAIFVLFAYVGFWIFIWIVNQVFLLPLPEMDWHVLLYMIVEFFIVAVMA